jgi:copper oxidase (laccase) domain-containing protein
VLERTIRSLQCAPEQLLAWLGPAIEPEAFEVGSEVREQFLAIDALHEQSFRQNARGRWQADLYGLARRTLNRAGVRSVHGGGFRCFEDHGRLFSYRRDQRTGRMASLIWLDAGKHD